MAAPASARYMALLGTVALLTAGLLLVARLCKLGFLADFLSRTVLVGFLTGVGLQVAIAMLGDLSGTTVTSRYSLMRIWQVVLALRDPNMPTLALSALVVTGILLATALRSTFPSRSSPSWRASPPAHGSIFPVRESR